MLVRERVIVSPEDVSIFQALQLDPSPARKRGRCERPKAMEGTVTLSL
jgi:hypothetical protein